MSQLIVNLFEQQTLDMTIGDTNTLSTLIESLRESHLIDKDIKNEQLKFSNFDGIVVTIDDQIQKLNGFLNIDLKKEEKEAVPVSVPKSDVSADSHNESMIDAEGQMNKFFGILEGVTNKIINKEYKAIKKMKNNKLDPHFLAFVKTVGEELDECQERSNQYDEALQKLIVEKCCDIEYYPRLSENQSLILMKLISTFGDDTMYLRQISQLQEKHEKLEKEIIQLKRAEDQMKTEYEAEIDKLSKSYAALQQTFSSQSSIKQTSESMAKEKKICENQNSTLKQKLTQANNFKINLEKDLDKLKKEKTKSNSEIKKLTEETKKFTEENKKLTEEINLLKRKQNQPNSLLKLSPILEAFNNQNLQQLFKVVGSTLNRKVKNVISLYQKKDRSGNSNIHQFVDEQPNIALIALTKSGYFIGGFSEAALSAATIKRQQGFLFSMRQPDGKFNILPLKKGQAVMQYDSEFIIFGYDEICISDREMSMSTTADKFRHNISCFCGYDDVTDGPFTQPQQPHQLVSFEIFQLKFE